MSDWRADASCQYFPDLDFVAPSQKEVDGVTEFDRCLAICATCLVRPECEEFSLTVVSSSEDVDGSVWGLLDYTERKLRREMAGHSE